MKHPRYFPSNASCKPPATSPDFVGSWGLRNCEAANKHHMPRPFSTEIKCNKFLWKNWQEILGRQCCKSWRSDPDMFFFAWTWQRLADYNYTYIYIMVLVYVENNVSTYHYAYKFSLVGFFHIFWLLQHAWGRGCFESRSRAICSQRVVIRPSAKSSSCWKMAQKCLSGWHMACIFRSLHIFFSVFKHCKFRTIKKKMQTNMQKPTSLAILLMRQILKKHLFFKL